MNDATIRIECDNETWFTTVSEFCDANQDDECDNVRNLNVGESMQIGGGAAELFTITRTK